MRIEYFEETDTLQITLSETEMFDALDLGEDTLAEFDARGQLVTLTLEHAHERTDFGSLLYKRIKRAD